jgi:hypothetical protein
MNSFRCTFTFLFILCSFFHHNAHSWPTLDKNSAFIAGGIGLGCGISIVGTYIYMQRQHTNYLNDTAMYWKQKEMALQERSQQVHTSRSTLEEARKAMEVRAEWLKMQGLEIDASGKKLEAEQRANIGATFNQHVRGARNGSILQRLILNMTSLAIKNGKSPESISNLDIADNLMDMAANNISIDAHGDSGSIQLQRAGLAEG